MSADGRIVQLLMDATAMSDRGDCACGHRWGIHIHPSSGRNCIGLGCKCDGYTPILLDRCGEVIDFSCVLDIDTHCPCPPCQMEQSFEAAYYAALFARQRQQDEDNEGLFEQVYSLADFALDEMKDGAR